MRPFVRRRRQRRTGAPRRVIIDDSDSESSDVGASSISGRLETLGIGSSADSVDSDASAKSKGKSSALRTPPPKASDGNVIDLCTPSPDPFEFGCSPSAEIENKENIMSTPRTTDRSRAFKSFQKNRESLARSAADAFNKSAFGDRLPRFEISFNSRLRTTAGMTRCCRGADGSRTSAVELSDKVIDSEARMRATLLHEMCHVAAWQLDGTCRPPHGAAFKKWASIASKSTGIPVTTRHNYSIFKKHVYKCVDCDATFKRHSKSIDVAKKVCGACRGRLVYEGCLNREGALAAARPATPYNKFVSEHFAEARKACGTPSEALKLVSRMWSQKKRNAVV